MLEYIPLKPGCACWKCGGCNRLEDPRFTGEDYCPGTDDEDKRCRPEQLQLGKQSQCQEDD